MPQRSCRTQVRLAIPIECFDSLEHAEEEAKDRSELNVFPKTRPLLPSWCGVGSQRVPRVLDPEKRYTIRRGSFARSHKVALRYAPL